MDVEEARMWVNNESTPITITKRFTFEAAHQLPFHNGKCHDLHGHSYVLEVSIIGSLQPDDPDNPASGMVIDFADMSKVVKPIISNWLDHKDLNDTLENPTAERILLFIVYALYGQFGDLLKHVKLWETETSSAEWDKP